MTAPLPTILFAAFSAALITFGFANAERHFKQQDIINQEIIRHAR